jgi:hypothetical protein
MLPQDKANHVLYGATLALFTQTLLVTLHVQFGVDLHGARPKDMGYLAAAIAGAVKEGLDKLANRRAQAAGLPPPHGVEWGDFLATASGGLLVWCSSP